MEMMRWKLLAWKQPVTETCRQKLLPWKQSEDICSHQSVSDFYSISHRGRSPWRRWVKG